MNRLNKGRVAILIAAAGASSRMGGRDKLLERVDGQPLLARQTARALATGRPVLVTLPPAKPLRAQALARLAPAETRIVQQARSGMSASLRLGAQWALHRRASGLLVVLADMPDLGSDDFASVIKAFLAEPYDVFRGSDHHGTPGHPVLIPARLFPALLKLRGDQGAGPLLRKTKVHLVPLPGHRALADLDTPEDWTRWRANRGKKGSPA